MNLHQLSAKLDDLIQFERGSQVIKSIARTYHADDLKRAVIPRRGSFESRLLAGDLKWWEKLKKSYASQGLKHNPNTGRIVGQHLGL